MLEVKYYLYSIIFKPYVDVSKEYDSNKILKKVASHLANIRQQGKAELVDRNENREKFPVREIFLSSAVMLPKERRIRCTMALIRKGKRPKLMKKGTFNLEDIKKFGDIVEITHFFIDYSSNENVICVEKNSHGPNISDIEYYFKKIARDDLQLAKTTTLKVHMVNSIESTLDSLKNVLSFNIKIRPSNLELINSELEKNYFQGFDTISRMYKPEHVKIEAFFKKQGGRSIRITKENKIATSMFRKALEIFKSDPEETDFYDNFVVIYEDGKGLEESFNLLKNKRFFERKVQDNEDLSQKESYKLIQKELTEFISEL